MNKEILSILDVLMSEYGWTIEYTMKLPITIIRDLYEKIIERQRADRKLQAQMQVISINAAFSDKGLEMIDKVFATEAEKEEAKEEEIDEAAQKGQMKELWVRMGKKPEDFEEQYQKGEVQF